MLTCAVTKMAVSVQATTAQQKNATFRFPAGTAPGDASLTTPGIPLPLKRKDVRLNQPKPMVSKIATPPKKAGVKTRFVIGFADGYAPVEQIVHVDYTDVSDGLIASSTIPITRDRDRKYRAEGAI